MTVLDGQQVRLRSATADDLEVLAAIGSTPAVRARWGSVSPDDLRETLQHDDTGMFVIEHPVGSVVGLVQWHEEDDPDYRHAGVDIFLHPDQHGQGIGADAMRTLLAHLIDDLGHHRITIDPAADNGPAIRCYERVGFKSVGVMRRYERIDGGPFHDGLLMDLLATEFVRHD